MATTCGPRPRQLPSQIIDVATWSRDEEYPVFPVGSKPKRLLKCPSDIKEPFLIAGHRYLYKVAQSWRQQQTWSEVLAYELGRSLPLSVPPAFIAIDSNDGSMGVLIEFFYGYPDDPTPPQYLHGTDMLQRIRRGQSYDPNTDRPHSVQMNMRICSTIGTQPASEWWASTMTFDALIGNTDRHPQNWGFLVKRIRPEEIDLELAPVFDNGTSFGYEYSDAQILQKWAPARMSSYIKKGSHHCSWQQDAVTGGNHLELCTALARASAVSGAAAINMIRLADSNIDELVDWCAQFDAPVRFNADRAEFVCQQLRARRDALASAIGA